MTKEIKITKDGKMIAHYLTDDEEGVERILKSLTGKDIKIKILDK